MARKILQSLGQIAAGHGRQRMPVDPARFNDPLARKTDWTPMASSATNMRLHVLKQVHANRMEFKMAAGIKVFAGLFIFVGCGLLIAAFFLFLSQLSGQTDIAAEGASEFNTNLPMAATGIVGLGFAAAGAFQYYKYRMPIVFDKGQGMFWKGRNGPGGAQHNAALNDIHALQMLRRLVISTKTNTNNDGRTRTRNISYDCYELNLVLKNGTRLNVTQMGAPVNAPNHRKALAFRKDAAALSAFLGKPVWDATQ